MEFITFQIKRYLQRLFRHKLHVAHLAQVKGHLVGLHKFLVFIELSIAADGRLWWCKLLSVGVVFGGSHCVAQELQRLVGRFAFGLECEAGAQLGAAWQTELFGKTVVVGDLRCGGNYIEI